MAILVVRPGVLIDVEADLGVLMSRARSLHPLLANTGRFFRIEKSVRKIVLTMRDSWIGATRPRRVDDMSPGSVGHYGFSLVCSRPVLIALPCYLVFDDARVDPASSFTKAIRALYPLIASETILIDRSVHVDLVALENERGYSMKNSIRRDLGGGC